jgi:hypothetical protein
MPIKFAMPRAVMVSTTVMLSAVEPLDIPPLRQWGDEWCWAACAEMVFGYYARPRAQCLLVNQLFGKHGCCAGNPPDPVAPGCDLPCKPEDVAKVYRLEDNGLQATMRTDPLAFAKFEAEIMAGRPVEVVINNHSGEHMILVKWVGVDDGQQMVRFDDPWNARDKTDKFANLVQVADGHWWSGMGKSNATP